MNEIKFIDLDFGENGDGRCELVIVREGGSRNRYHPTQHTLNRLSRLCRALPGQTYPFANGWLWIPSREPGQAALR